MHQFLMGYIWLQFTTCIKEIQVLVCVFPCNLGMNFPLWLHRIPLVTIHKHMLKLETPYQEYPVILLLMEFF